MPIEKSAGAVIFRKENGKIHYLLLHYPSASQLAPAMLRDEAAASASQTKKSRAPRDYWDFPKGHIEKGEKEIDTAKREVEEETGLKDIEFVEDFKSGIRYFFRFQGENILKFVTFYLAQTQTKDIKVSAEHLGFAWLTYEEALARLKFKNAKETLQKAYEFLTKPRNTTSSALRAKSPQATGR